MEYSVLTNNSCKKTITNIKFTDYENGKILNENGLKITLKKSKKRYELEIENDNSKMISYMNRFLFYCENMRKYNDFDVSEFMKMYGGKHRTKEICESMSALSYTLKHCEDILNNKNILCLVVADGMNPKTGILLSVKTEWNVISIDPILKEKWVNNKIIPNLSCYNDLVENVIDSILIENENVDQVVIVGVHSHANLNNVWKKIDKKKFCLSIPCCAGYEHYIKDHEPIFCVQDMGIPSPKNFVYGWEK